MNTGDLGPLADRPAEQSDSDKLHNCRQALRAALEQCSELSQHALPPGTVACWRGQSFPIQLADLLPPNVKCRFINGMWYFVSKTQ